MGTVVTVTLNPSLDKTLITRHLNIGYHNRVADTTQLDASGRGVNVSRALDTMGISTQAVVLLGQDATSYAYKGLIAEESFRTQFVSRPGPMRSDTIIVDRGLETETHIIDEGAGGAPEHIDHVRELLMRLVQPEDTVVFAGTLPSDAASDTYMRLAAAVRPNCEKLVIMCCGDALSHGLRAGPDLVALTELEAESMFNYPVRTVNDMVSAGTKLRAQGAGQALVTACDHRNAVLVTADEAWHVEIAELETIGTDSGVADALVAGYLAGLLQGQEPEEALRLGAAACSYTASHIGNVFGTPEQLQQCYHKTAVVAVNDKLQSTASIG